MKKILYSISFFSIVLLAMFFAGAFSKDKMPEVKEPLNTTAITSSSSSIVTSTTPISTTLPAETSASFTTKNTEATTSNTTLSTTSAAVTTTKSTTTTKTQTTKATTVTIDVSGLNPPSEPGMPYNIKNTEVPIINPKNNSEKVLAAFSKLTDHRFTMKLLDQQIFNVNEIKPISYARLKSPFQWNSEEWFVVELQKDDNLNQNIEKIQSAFHSYRKQRKVEFGFSKSTADNEGDVMMGNIHCQPCEGVWLKRVKNGINYYYFNSIDNYVVFATGTVFTIYYGDDLDITAELQNIINNLN